MKTFLLALSLMLVNATQAIAQSPEAVHIHFDKDIYLPGETIWFKAYIYNGSHASGLSTNFYTAVYDEDGKLLQQKQYPIFEGTANGDFELPDTLRTRRLQFISFTKGMLLNDSDNIYKKTISIYQKSNKLPGFPDKNEGITLNFFAEGGNSLIEGITNHIAYKANYNNGNPAQVKGSIIELGSAGEIDSFYTNSDGMGKLQFIPTTGKSYFAVWKNENGQVINTALPVIAQYGVSLHTEEAGNFLHYIITKNSTAANYNKLKLVAQMGNEKVYEADILLDKAMQLVDKIPIDSFSNGLMQLTLSGADNNILQTRMLLINKKESAPALMHTERSAKPKAKNVIEFTVPDTLIYNLSASIADVNFYDKTQTSNIQQELWFNRTTRPLREKIIRSIINYDRPTIDLLMLTNAAYRYTTMQTDKSLDDYLSISINYTDKNYALPKNESATLVVNDKITGKQFYKLSQNSQTNFTKTGLIFYDSARLHYMADKTKHLEKFVSIHMIDSLNLSKYIGRLKNNFYQTFPTISKSMDDNDSLELDPFYVYKPSKFNEERTIKGIVIKSKYVNPETKRFQELDDKYTSGMFSGLVRGYQVNVVDDENAWAASDLLSYITYKFPFITTMASGKFMERGLYTIDRDSNKPAKLLTFIDETELPDQIGLSSISMSQIAYIKFINGIVIGSSFRTSTGVLYIYKRKGDEKVLSGTPNMQSKIFKGYNVPKEFFNPDYSDPAELKIKDIRSTVYWNPYIVADKANNKIQIEYFNNDISKKLLLTIEGFNSDGKLIHIEKLIEN